MVFPDEQLEDGNRKQTSGTNGSRIELVYRARVEQSEPSIGDLKRQLFHQPPSTRGQGLWHAKKAPVPPAAALTFGRSNRRRIDQRQMKSLGDLQAQPQTTKEKNKPIRLLLSSRRLAAWLIDPGVPWNPKAKSFWRQNPGLWSERLAAVGRDAVDDEANSCYILCTQA